MFIGHISAGYIYTKAILSSLPQRYLEAIYWRYALSWGLLGSVLPDFDMFYFYFIDHAQHLHHSYCTHLPIYWLCLSAGIFIILFVLGRPSQVIYAFLCLSNVFIHLFLDTLMGKIRWFYPFSNYDFVCFYVPNRYSWWVWNFVFHWTFFFEIALIIIAIFLFLKS